jgi:D-glycero-alpha-D-manno-heptose-7-phosphate kinase
MIISRTPYRISFFGGGTDYHTWYEKHGGAVLSTAINHYCYITARQLPPFFKEKSRVVWSRLESVDDNSEIQHPSVRGVLEYLGIDQGVEINHTGDLPARAGLGSSSSFTVGMLNAMHALQGNMSNQRQLASQAIHVERNLLKENVGIQDQIAAAYGGFNKISFQPSGDFTVEPVIMAPERFLDLQNHCLMFFTGVSRTASDIAKQQIETAHDKTAELHAMRKLVDEALSVLAGNADLAEFGKLLHETWQIKRSLAVGIAPHFVDVLYERARQAGAIGGKLLGAGGGGFLLFFARPEDHARLKQELSDLLYVPFKFEPSGSNIIFYEPSAYTRDALTRRDFYHLREQNEEAARSTLTEDDLAA